ncbi:MAG TPA: RsmB/NOP family class I SAM-dependent RNA methyltransferase, partial [Bacteroidia bacterium]|nr:RsmB/NOP family class I SAM-dependent RNA methyltransferase [Bacteroidia bacterium]
MILPSDFVNHLKQHINQADKVLDALTQPSNTSIRHNVSKTKNAFDLKHLEQIAWAENGYYLSQRPLFTVDPFFQSGYYYVQEAGSMFIGEIIKQLGLNKSTVCGLDLCAAPGGKSTHVLSMLQPESVLVSNEIIKTRTPVLIDNLIKWGLPNYIVTQSDARKFGLLPALFDFILCDAPCSGEGMLRKSNDALHHWSLNNVNLCAQRQQRIVHDVWPSLKSGGYFIYATCTFNVIENEENITSFTETLPANSIKLQTQNGIVESITKNKNGHLVYGYRLMPGLVNAEGLFIAVFQKSEAVPNNLSRIKSPAIKTGHYKN